MKSLHPLLLAGTLFVATAAALADRTEESMSLAGPWRFQLDRADAGVAEQWFNRRLADRLELPGSLQEQGFGDDISTNTPWTGSLNDRSWFTAARYAPYRAPGHLKVPFWLQPEKYYVGAAWYQRDVNLPSAWRGKRVALQVERAHWGTTVWVDDRRIGQQDALGVPHLYDLGTDLAPGPHRLTIRVDNRVLVPVGNDAHSVSDHTQGNWNGLAGDLRLWATEPLWVDDVQVFPKVAERKVRVRVRLGNHTGRSGSGTLQVSAQGFNASHPHQPPTRTVPVQWTADGGAAEFDYELGRDAQRWDEFNPALYRLTVALSRERLGQTEDPSGTGWAAAKSVTFGLREVGVAGKQITVNDRKIFLRGTLECCIFPQHGYPPTDVASWKRLLRVARAHGLNHLRFHSWCPPAAAFTAADELGFYFQIECSAWAYEFNKGTALDAWIQAESERIVREHGNHPSFLLLVPSNEPGGPEYEKFLGRWVAHWKSQDPRRLYSAGSGWPQVPENQYHITANSRAFPVHAVLGETANDYRRFLATQTAPIVSHEIGQYCVFPNLDEIPKYRGLLRAKNFEIVREFMAQAGLERQAHDFLRASGRLQTLFYKDEIEACLRTPGWAGFQLLDLHDFPGQGTALVGVLDAFWEEKGYVTPTQYRRFCDETVPLARLPKRIWTGDETFRAAVDIAHFGAADRANVQATWRIRDGTGKSMAHGQLSTPMLATGEVTPIGEVVWPLRGLRQAAALHLEVAVPGTRFANDWNFWVYPAATATATPPGLTVVTRLEADARQALARGGRVVLLADPRTVQGRTVGRFDPIFWNKLWFPTQPQHTLGLVLEPKHPALAEFPTAFHADWQWQDLQNHSRPMILDALPRGLRPLVQVIDDWNTCRKLGLVFEAAVGPGRLLVCSIDLNQDLAQRPVARQLRRSLLDYAASSRFQPKTRLNAAQVQSLFRDLTLTEKLGAKVIRANSEQPGFPASHILDGDPQTLWHTAWGDGAPRFPHEVVIGLASPAPLDGLRLLPRQDGNRNGWIKDYVVYVSDDGINWGEPIARGSLEADATEQAIRFARTATGKFIRLVANSGFDAQPFASLAELSLLAVLPK